MVKRVLAFSERSTEREKRQRLAQSENAFGFAEVTSAGWPSVAS